MASSSVPLSATAPTNPQAGGTAASPAAKTRWGPFRFRQEPFFEDKNRAFWILQSMGWAGFFVLRTLSGIANSMGWSFVIHTALLTATGYSITLLMAAVYRRLIKLRPLVTWVSSIFIVLLCSAAFSAIETWSYATFLKPGSRPIGIELMSRASMSPRFSPTIFFRPPWRARPPSLPFSEPK